MNETVRGCGNCKFNPMGVCTLCDLEIPIGYVMRRNKGVPRFCPLKGEDK